MKKIIFILPYMLLLALFINCKSTQKPIVISEEENAVFNQKEGDAHTIKGEESEYDIIIIDIGFNSWLQSIAKPKGFYSQSYMESRNTIYVMEWNNRVLQPSNYNPDLYELQIDYDANTDYGYDVNYQLYNYFIYFQRKYKQRLGPFIPRI